jgi:hypothetical protein
MSIKLMETLPTGRERTKMVDSLVRSKVRVRAGVAKKLVTCSQLWRQTCIDYLKQEHLVVEGIKTPKEADYLMRCFVNDRDRLKDLVDSLVGMLQKIEPTDDALQYAAGDALAVYDTMSEYKERLRHSMSTPDLEAVNDEQWDDLEEEFPAEDNEGLYEEEPEVTEEHSTEDEYDDLLIPHVAEDAPIQNSNDRRVQVEQDILIEFLLDEIDEERADELRRMAALAARAAVR